MQILSIMAAALICLKVAAKDNKKDDEQDEGQSEWQNGPLYCNFCYDRSNAHCQECIKNWTEHISDKEDKLRVSFPKNPFLQAFKQQSRFKGYAK